MIGDVPVPQVLHTDPSGDLAGGNFAYITGGKSGYGPNPNRRGHNVVELGSAFKETLDSFRKPPGWQYNMYHAGARDVRDYLSCAGDWGCHGIRDIGLTDRMAAIKGAHHRNLNGKITTDVYNGTIGAYYRFLYGVKGYESPDWQNLDSSHHNEYYGTSPPPSGYYGCTICHTFVPNLGRQTVSAYYGTISNFCATCHGDFHKSETVGSSSPWLRHPTDVIIPNGGEFSNYTTYDVSVPVARTTVPDSPLSTVTPGQDVVMCLSCHYAHAGPYPSMLRWDYDLLDSPEKRGCKRCHNDK